MKPRIALLSSYPPDFASFTGGVETATAGLLEGLRGYQGEFEFHVVSVSNSISADRRERWDGFLFHFLSLPQPWVRPRFPYRIARIIDELNRVSPDLVHCQGSMDLALATIWSGYPRLFTIHGIRRQEADKRVGWERWSARFDACIEPYIYRCFQDFICISEYVRHTVSNSKQTYLVPNAVRTAFFSVRRSADPDSPRLLFVGSFSPLKRPMDLIVAHHALRGEFPALETTFCGEPENQRFFDDLRANAGHGIHFVGRLDQTELIRELGRATALVLPSVQENAPLVIAEAMAAGVPVVATNVGGIPEMLKNELAETLYRVGDVDSLTTILRGILSEPERAKRLAEVAKSEARRYFGTEKVAVQTVNVYREILQREKRVKDR